MNLPPTKDGGPRPAAASAARFAHASGSRPLAGYTIKRGVGHGGFGEVYYATSDAGKEVALKLIRRSLDIELRGIKQCLNLKHPNLLDVYDIREDERGDHWVVMEYVAGESLDNALDTHPNGLPLPEALAWFYGIAAGVAYLHDHGIVHRDLKPANIFSDEGRVQIGDYGLSKFISCSRRSGHTESVGTVHYMAPEVANGRYGKEIDIYALGIILYEMLTGRVPFEGESVGEVLMKHLTAKPDVSMIEEPYRSVVARALEKDPAERYSSVGQMLADLPGTVDLGARVGPLPSMGSSERGESASGVDEVTRVRLAVSSRVRRAVLADDEPVLRALKDLLADLRRGWNGLTLPAQIALGVLGVVAAIFTYFIWIPLGVVSLIVYASYRIVRAVFLAGQPRAASPPPTEVEPVSPELMAEPTAADRPTNPWRPRRHRRPRRPERAIPALVLKPAPQRVAELLGAMLLGAMVALTICLVMVIVTAFRTELPQPEQCAWLALMSVAGTWAVMLPSKLWEGTRGEPVLRRFVLMVVGLALGVMAWATADWLMVELPYDPHLPSSPGFRMPNNFYAGGPLLLAYMAVFGTLLLALQWWRQADPLRHARMSVWSLLVTAVVAGLVGWLWHFPQPWLVLVACAMSGAVQLSSPWLPPRERQGGVTEED